MRPPARAAILAALLLIASCARAPGPGVGAGQPLPPRSFPMLEGPGEVALAAGTPTVVNIWATWCEPCRREMQSLEKLHQRSAASGMRVIGISVDSDPRLAAEFVRAQRLTFANGIDLHGALARSELAVTKFPTTLVVDAAGVVRWRVESARDWADEETAARLAALFP